ncbi:ABC transporter ATP-binding protein [Luteolibacter luteus]|uniref:ABC transporter ATP-binding protein n=1 Tax=Luteolibacter luteus TaxID=2728835 RepID=A0A858RCN0_9BACT|nr:ABC transporter ATP-binding protein [Luteolibacter luteus]QJE94445.1 ABC transporter ATP-binding protein [Luteolibacter luteus]
MNPATIQLSDVSKVYRSGDMELRAVKNLSLEVRRGEFVAIMGPSGSGKSTLMNMLGCLDRPTEGTYLLDGVSLANSSRKELSRVRNGKIGFVFQNFNLLSRTTACENVELPMCYSSPGVSAGERRKRALESLEKVGLGARTDHRPNQLSGGQQQRVAIARALVNRPELLLADEPTGNLDTRTSIEIMGLFQELNDAGITIVMVTHELDIAAYCKRNVVMRDGRIVRDTIVENRTFARDQRAELDASELQADLV